ncbi:hypothetical protein V8G54_015240, partial [Vigna mungo]
ARRVTFEPAASATTLNLSGFSATISRVYKSIQGKRCTTSKNMRRRQLKLHLQRANIKSSHYYIHLSITPRKKIEYSFQRFTGIHRHKISNYVQQMFASKQHLAC